MKPFGKLSPDDKISASLMPMLYDRPHKVLDKLRHAINNDAITETIDVKIQERMDMGNFLEEKIMELIQDRLDIKIKYPVDEVMSQEIGMTADRRPLDLYASLDGIFHANQPKKILAEDRRIYVEGGDQIELLGPVPVEIKNMQHKPYDHIDCMTVDHGRGYLQLQAQMMIADAQFGIIGCLFNGNDLRVFVCKANQEVQDNIVEKCLAVYEHLENDTDFEPVDLEMMAQKYDQVKQTDPIQLDNTLMGDIEHYESLKEQRKTTEEEMERVQMRMIKALGDAEEGLVHHNGGITKLSRPARHYKAQPAKYVEAKEARTIRAKTVSIKHVLEEWK